MLRDIKSVLRRAEATIWQDFAGGLALLIMLIGGLYLPGLT